MSQTPASSGALPASPPFDFVATLSAVTPHLRAFARGLCGRPDLADDLVQDTMLRAWAARDRFVPGTSMRAWTFTILRNTYLTDLRRRRFQGDYDEAAAARILVQAPEQDAGLHLADLHAALMRLPAERREALLLVGAGGFSYEEAAEICGCAVGTIKSRVARARAALAAMMADEGPQAPALREGRVAEAERAIMAELDEVTRRARNSGTR